MIPIILGLGSNLPHPDGRSSIEIIQTACIKLDAMINANAIIDVSRSSIYSSPPWGPTTDQPAYINCVLRIDVDRKKVSYDSNPENFAIYILEACHKIEAELGRHRNRSDQFIEPPSNNDLRSSGNFERHYQARTIDIDILLIGDLKLNTDLLTVPHPEYLKRDFVLVPAVEVASHILDPNELKTLANLLIINQPNFALNNLTPVDPGVGQ